MTTRILYIARYDDHMYPEDNETLGCSWDEAEAQKIIDDTISYYATTDHGKTYGQSFHRANSLYYSIEEIHTPPT